MCKGCGANFNVNTLPPKADGICDKCEGELYQRKDDMPETIENRLVVYGEQTSPLIEYYTKKGVIKEVNASSGSIEEIVGKIKEALGS
jgi:adenylate kinase